MFDFFIYRIAESAGSRVRYHFLKLIGKPKSLKYLKGDLDDGVNSFGNGCLNIFVGIPIVFAVIFGIVYVCFALFD